MQQVIRFVAAGLAVTAAFLGGCSTTMQMVVPGDVAGVSQVIAATDRSIWSGALADETFGLGPYRVSRVDRDWDSGSASGFSIADFGFSSGKTEGGYVYLFETPEGRMQGQCLTKVKDAELSLGSVSFESRVAGLSCICSRGKTEVARVSVQADITEGYNGILTTGDRQYKVVSINAREGGWSSGPTGYRIDSDRPIGAVEVLKPGRIWLARNFGEPQRGRLACNLAGLMLYLPPTD